MQLVLICVAGLAMLAFALYRMRRLWEGHRLQEHSIDADQLHAQMNSKHPLLLFDLRLPLDLLAHSEIIPGSTRISPKELLAHTSLLPKDKDSVVYCTCETEETSRMVLKRALALGFDRVKFLTGGFEAWKAKGYPVESYDVPFHLDTAV